MLSPQTRRSTEHVVFWQQVAKDTFPGGAEKRILAYCRAIDHSAVKVTLLVTYDVYRPLLEAEGLPVDVVEYRSFLNREGFRRFWEVRRQLRAMRADRLVLVQGDFWNFRLTDYLAAVLQTRGKIWDLHVSSPHPPRSATPIVGLWRRRLHEAQRRMSRWRTAMRGALPKRVFAVSTEAKRRMVEWYGYAEHRVEVVHHGIPLNHYSPDLASGLEVRERLGIAPEATVVICTSRLSPEKRVDRTIDAFCLFLQDCPSATLLLVGDGPSRGEIEAQIESSGARENIRMLGFQRDVVSYLRAADFFVLTSDREGLSNAMLEAMACGAIPVVTRVAGAEDAIHDGVTGFITDFSAEATYAGLVRALRLTTEAREGLRERARTFVLSEFDVRRGIAKMLRALQLPQPKSGPAVQL